MLKKIKILRPQILIVFFNVVGFFCLFIILMKRINYYLALGKSFPSYLDDGYVFRL